MSLHFNSLMFFFLCLLSARIIGFPNSGMAYWKYFFLLSLHLIFLIHACFIYLFIYFWFFKTGFLCSFGAWAGTNSCRPGWPQTHKDSPASASWVLGLKACTTTTWLYLFLLFIFVKLYICLCSPSLPLLSSSTPSQGSHAPRRSCLFLLLM